MSALRSKIIAKERRGMFKVAVAVDADAERRRRANVMVQIRRIKRDGILVKKRSNMLMRSSPSTVRPYLESLPDMIAGVLSNDLHLQFHMISNFINLLSAEDRPPIQEVIDAGVVPRFVEFLTRDDVPNLQIGATCVLSCIAYGESEQIKIVVDNGAVSIFVKFLSSPIPDLREQAVLALGNIAGDSLVYRDFVLANGVLEPLAGLLRPETSLSMAKSVTFTLSNLCLWKTGLPYYKITIILSAIKPFILLSNDEELITNSCLALSSIIHGNRDIIQAVVDLGVCPRVVEFLLHPSPSVHNPALVIVWNITKGNVLQIETIINCNILHNLRTLLIQRHDKTFKRTICMTISILSAFKRIGLHIQDIIDAQLIPPLMNLLRIADYGIKKKAACVISNITSYANQNQINYIVSQGSINTLCDLLACSDPQIILNCLTGLENILNRGEMGNPFAKMIDEAEGWNRIYNLFSLDDDEINQKALKILKTHECVDENN